jgi:ATP-dependent Clp protease ATP-binding subunit ClpB
LRQIKEEIEKTKVAIEQAKREYDFNRAAELQYGKLAQLERDLAAEETRLQGEPGQSRLLKEEVDEDDIAAVVSRWTGVPVAKLLEGEKEKLLRLGVQ